MRQKSKIAKISADPTKVLLKISTTPTKCQREHVIPTKILLKISMIQTKNFLQKFPKEKKEKRITEKMFELL